jgi:uncharacterized membrane protein YhaH (DUF805 family)
MMEWYNNRFANFDSRSSRSEYGYYILFNVVLVLIIYSMNLLTENKLASFFNLCIFQLVMFVPMQAVTIRRLKDLGMRWQFFLLNFIPFVNFFFSIYLLITAGERGDNQFGSDPKVRSQIVEFDYN